MSTFSDRSYDSSNYQKLRPTYPQTLYDRLRQYAGLAEGERADIVVDLGCGPGEATSALARSVGSKIFGVDPSEVMLDQAREKAKDLTNVDFINGNDETLTSQFKKHSVDILTIAEAAHWFTYPDFWETAHYLLKPGGTLAIWSYYIFSFVGYPEVGRLIEEFSINKLGPYWNPGQSRLNDLYKELVPPAHLFENEERVLSDLGQVHPGQAFELFREDVTVGDALKLLTTYSAYHTWKKQNPDKPDIIDQVTKEILEKANLTLESIVTVKWASVYSFSKSKE